VRQCGCHHEGGRVDDLVGEMNKIADANNTKVEFISGESEEGRPSVEGVRRSRRDSQVQGETDRMQSDDTFQRFKEQVQRELSGVFKKLKVETPVILDKAPEGMGDLAFLASRSRSFSRSPRT